MAIPRSQAVIHAYTGQKSWSPMNACCLDPLSLHLRLDCLLTATAQSGGQWLCLFTLHWSPNAGTVRVTKEPTTCAGRDVARSVVGWRDVSRGLGVRLERHIPGLGGCRCGVNFTRFFSSIPARRRTTRKYLRALTSSSKLSTWLAPVWGFCNPNNYAYIVSCVRHLAYRKKWSGFVRAVCFAKTDFLKMFAMICNDLFCKIVNLRYVPKTVPHCRWISDPGGTATSSKLIWRTKHLFWLRRKGPEGKGSGGR